MTLSSPVRPVTAEDPPLTVADAIIDSLVGWQIDAIFGVSGANIEHLHDAVHRRGLGRLRSVAARSESGAAFMADAYARVNGRLGVCCSTSGGGMMNLAVGVAESYQEGIPVLAIVGQVARSHEGTGGFQDSSGRGRTVAAAQMWRAIAKDVREVRSGETLWDDLLGAVRAALSGRPGPAVLLVPRDVWEIPVEARPNDWPQTLSEVSPPMTPPVEAMDRLEHDLRSARHPVMVVGALGLKDGANSAVRSFARRAQVPVVTTLADVGAYPQDDSLYLGTIGTAGHPSAHRYINEQADLILVVGSRLEMMLSAPILPALGRAKIWFVDVDTSCVQERFPDASLLEADVSITLQSLASRWPLFSMTSGRPEGYRQERFLPQLAPPVSGSPSLDDSVEAPLLQSEALALLEQVLPQDGHLLFDAGNCAASALHYLTVPSKTSTTIALGMGGMGYAIPAAVGAQLGGQDDRPTVVLCGDGAFLLLGLEIHTAVDLGLPILFVVFNNGAHGMCVTRQQLFFDSRIECSQYADVNVAHVARGLGNYNQLWVQSAQTRRELEQAIVSYKQWGGRGPGVLELVLRQEEIPPFTPFLPADAPVGDSALADLLSPAKRSHCAA